MAGIYVSPPNQVIIDLRLELGKEVDANEIARAVGGMIERIGIEVVE